MGNITTTEYVDPTDAVKFTFDQEFDELGRLLNHLGANGQEWQYRHDKEDNLDLVTDPLGHTVSNVFDPLNRVISVIDENGEVPGDQAIEMEYNDHDQVTSYTDQRSLETTTTYNGFGEVVSEASPDKGTTSYTYNSRGLVESMTDARGVQMVYEYDDLGRVTAKRFPASPGDDLEFLFDLVPAETGAMSQARDDVGNHDLNYDAQGRLRSTVQRAEGAVQVTTYLQYDADDNLERLVYGPGRSVRYGYDSTGRINSVKWQVGGVITPIVNNVQWEPFGAPKRINFSNGVTYIATHDQSYRLASQVDRRSDLSVMRGHTYTYSTRDNLILENDSQNPDTSQRTYSYNERQQLSASTAFLGPDYLASDEYDYDSVGNRIERDHKEYDLTQGGSLVVDNVQTLAYPAGSNRLQALTGTNTETRSFTYDHTGNTVQEVRTISALTDTWQYIYNSAGRLVEVKLNGATQAKYKYNWRGLQVVRSDFSSGTEVRTVSQFDADGRRIAEFDVDIVTGTHTRLREYVWLDDYPIAVIEDDEIFTIHFDQINRPIQATNDNEEIVWQVRYDAFGAINVELANTGALSEMNLRFPGQWYQAETGLHQNWHRDYDPTLGRYLQADPLGLIDGPSV